MTTAYEYKGERNIAGWDTHWRKLQLPKRPKLWNPSTYLFHRFFKRNIPVLRGKRVLEIGCCPGRWMAYFRKYHGALVTGIDYSDFGCQVTRINLKMLHIDAEVFCGDIRQSGLDIGTYDMVYSMGVVEHYTDLVAMVSDHVKFVSPGGYLVITMPNFAGIHGRWIFRLDEERYSEHVPYSLDQLVSAATAVGLTVENACAFGGIDPLLIFGNCRGVCRIAALGLRFVAALIPAKGHIVSSYLGLVCRRKGSF